MHASAPEGTALTVVHERFADGAEADSHRQGWNDCLDRLDRLGQEKALPEGRA